MSKTPHSSKKEYYQKWKLFIKDEIHQTKYFSNIDFGKKREKEEKQKKKIKKKRK